MWNWVMNAAVTGSIGVLLVGVAVVLAVSASVGMGVASLWMSEERGAHVLKVMGRLAQLVAALRGKAPPDT